MVQDHVLARAWRFKSSLRHHFGGGIRPQTKVKIGQHSPFLGGAQYCSAFPAFNIVHVRAKYELRIRGSENIMADTKKYPINVEASNRDFRYENVEALRGDFVSEGEYWDWLNQFSYTDSLRTTLVKHWSRVLELPGRHLKDAEYTLNRLNEDLEPILKEGYEENHLPHRRFLVAQVVE